MDPPFGRFFSDRKQALKTAYDALTHGHVPCMPMRAGCGYRGAGFAPQITEEHRF